MALLLLGLIDIAASSAIRAAAHAPLRAAVAMSSCNPGGGLAPNLERHNGVFDRFLLQRAVQTQIYYLDELHDRPLARFVAHFIGHAGIESRILVTASAASGWSGWPEPTVLGRYRSPTCK
jgi:hypothetical protein